MPENPILVINTGSSSLKLGLYVEHEAEENLLFDGLADGIGREDGSLVLRDGDGKTLRSEKRFFHHAGRCACTGVRMAGGSCAPRRLLLDIAWFMADRD